MWSNTPWINNNVNNVQIQEKEHMKYFITS